MSPAAPSLHPEVHLVFGRLLRRRAWSGRPTPAVRWWDAGRRSYRLTEVPADFDVDGVARAEADDGSGRARAVAVVVAPGNRRQARDTLAYFRGRPGPEGQPRPASPMAVTPTCLGVPSLAPELAAVG